MYVPSKQADMVTVRTTLEAIALDAPQDPSLPHAEKSQTLHRALATEFKHFSDCTVALEPDQAMVLAQAEARTYTFVTEKVAIGLYILRSKWCVSIAVFTSLRENLILISAIESPMRSDLDDRLGSSRIHRGSVS